MTLCRAKPELLELGNSLPIAAQVDRRAQAAAHHRLGSSSTRATACPIRPTPIPPSSRWGSDKALPGVDVDVVNRGIGGQDVEEMSTRMRAEMKANPASLVVWQTGTNAAIRHDAARQVRALAARRPGARQVAGRRLRADEPAVRAGRRRAARQGSLREGHGRRSAKEYDAGLFRRFDIMRGWYDDGMPYAQFVQLDGLHLNDFGQKCIGKLLSTRRSILNSAATSAH